MVCEHLLCRERGPPAVALRIGRSVLVDPAAISGAIHPGRADIDQSVGVRCKRMQHVPQATGINILNRLSRVAIMTDCKQHRACIRQAAERAWLRYIRDDGLESLLRKLGPSCFAARRHVHLVPGIQPTPCHALAQITASENQLRHWNTSLQSIESGESCPRLPDSRYAVSIICAASWSRRAWRFFFVSLTVFRIASASAVVNRSSK